MTTITFNTGRMYGAKGQRIAAANTPDGGIAFNDVDRGIHGYIPAAIVQEFGLTVSQADVMMVYDRQLCEYWAGTFDHQAQLTELGKAARAI